MEIFEYAEYSGKLPEERQRYLDEVGNRIPEICWPARERGEFDGDYGKLTSLLSQISLKEPCNEIKSFATKLLFSATIYKPGSSKGL
jgi:hypothetical protein